MNSIVLTTVAAYRADRDASGGAPGHAPLDGGPQVTSNLRLDHDTHDWPRTTAVHARPSLHALVGTAVVHAHAGRGRGTPWTLSCRRCRS